MFLPSAGALAVLSGPGVPDIFETHVGEDREGLASCKVEPEKEEGRGQGKHEQRCQVRLARCCISKK